MVKLAEAIFRKKNEFGPLGAEFMKNARASSRDKAASLSMESIVSSSSNGKRKSIDEDVPKEELPAKKKGKKTATPSTDVEPVEKKTRKKKLIISVSMIQMFLTWGEGRVDIPEKTLRAQKPKTNGTAKEEIRANIVR